jgi:nitrogen fixation protein NifT
MKVMIRKNGAGELSAYVAKKDLVEPIVTLANGWKLALPEMAQDTRLPITVEARRLGE